MLPGNFGQPVDPAYRSRRPVGHVKSREEPGDMQRNGISDLLTVNVSEG